MVLWLTTQGVKKILQVAYAICFKKLTKNNIKAESTMLKNCEHVLRSPFSKAVQSLVHKHGIPIKSFGGISNPHGIAINQKGELMVTDIGDWGRHYISVLSSSGEMRRSFGSWLHYPSDLTIDTEGNILIVDNGNHCIKKYTEEGRYITDYYSEGIPFGIVVHPINNKIYITCHNTDKIEVLTSDLKLISTFGSRGSDKANFIHPHGIACDSAGRIFVADCGNRRIQVFTPEGEFLKYFGMPSKGKGKVPGGIAVDCNDLVYITEWDNHCVSVYTSKDQFVTSFGKSGNGLGEFNRPIGIAVDRCGFIYVCDSDNDRVQVF